MIIKIDGGLLIAIMYREYIPIAVCVCVCVCVCVRARARACVHACVSV